SRALIERIDASQVFDVVESEPAHLSLVIPSGFANDLSHSGHATVQIISDASDPNRATTLNTYLTAIIADHQLAITEAQGIPYVIRTTTRFLYNPQLKGAPNFVPGVMALVLMLVCVMMTSISIVREKELGTMEILLVSPFRPLMVIVAKVIPYLLLSIVNITSILLLSVYVLGLPILGSILLLFGMSILFIITSLALGVLVSTIAATQQVAMLVSMMGMLLPTLLFSGFMFPIENMPLPLQVISNLIPAKWYYNIVKAVMIKGLGIDAILKEVVILLGMSVLLTVISVRRFKVRLA
ncbi:MAG: ABC transporter permease, partial [Candidatus Kapabacteria bacterium]|nr:ABC transporter permease [Candidatus Kapabacteria bacterium]